MASATLAITLALVMTTITMAADNMDTNNHGVSNIAMDISIVVIVATAAMVDTIGMAERDDTADFANYDEVLPPDCGSERDASVDSTMVVDRHGASRIAMAVSMSFIALEMSLFPTAIGGSASSEIAESTMSSFPAVPMAFATATIVATTAMDIPIAIFETPRILVPWVSSFKDLTLRESTTQSIQVSYQDLLRLDRFNCYNFTRWQEKVLFFLTEIKLSYILGDDLADIPTDKPDDKEGRKLKL
ncbi:hypothetical protein ZIOFF_017239 [Zingiber officinale]|uniref:Uncharacterized protein n=1 Tax=Zingiber officinale TaxID=94328 RepID=A0A8J5LI65_ZINOF|nr:hypothetical protein ZIOFF_017239 [Zingiber officinale]